MLNLKIKNQSQKEMSKVVKQHKKIINHKLANDSQQKLQNKMHNIYESNKNIWPKEALRNKAQAVFIVHK